MLDDIRLLDKLFRMLHDVKVWTCTKCGYAIDGMVVDTTACLSSSRDRTGDIHCPKCGHLDAPMQKRTYGLSVEKLRRCQWSFTDKKENPWWTKKTPLWTLNRDD